MTIQCCHLTGLLPNQEEERFQKNKFLKIDINISYLSFVKNVYKTHVNLDCSVQAYRTAPQIRYTLLYKNDCDVEQIC